MVSFAAAMVRELGLLSSHYCDNIRDLKERDLGTGHEPPRRLEQSVSRDGKRRLTRSGSFDDHHYRKTNLRFLFLGRGSEKEKEALLGGNG